MILQRGHERGAAHDGLGEGRSTLFSVRPMAFGIPLVDDLVVTDDQQRLRENLKALKGSAEERALTQRYTQQLADQETRLEAIQRETADLQSKRDQAQSQLDKMIEDLTLDTTL